MDVALVAIDFSKGNIKEGVVDSLLSWELIKTTLLVFPFKVDGLYA